MFQVGEVEGGLNQEVDVADVGVDVADGRGDGGLEHQLN
jgi:hypothetical protein